MSFISASLQTIVIRFALIGIGLLGGIINARWLGPEGLGIVTLLLLVKTFAFRFGNLGFGSAFAFFVARRKALLRRILPLTLIVSFIVSLACGLLLFGIWETSLSPWNDIQPLLFYFALLSLPLNFYNNFVQRVLSGKLKITAINLVNFTSGFAYVGFLVIFVISIEFGIFGSLLASLMADLLTTIIFAIIAYKELRNEKIEQFEEIYETSLTSSLWKYGRWSYLLMLTNFLVEELPIVLLKKFTGSNVLVGLFSRARSLGRQSRSVIEPVSKVLFPFTAASSEEHATRRTNVLCRNSTIIMALTITVLMLFIEPLILFMYGAEFLPSVPMFYALAPGVIVWPLGQFLEVHVAASGRPKDIFFASIFTLLTGLGICFLLIPSYGAVGAGWSISITYLFRAVFRLIAYSKMTGARLSEILFPRREDLIYYQYLITLPRTWIRKAKAT